MRSEVILGTVSNIDRLYKRHNINNVHVGVFTFTKSRYDVGRK